MISLEQLKTMRTMKIQKLLTILLKDIKLKLVCHWKHQLLFEESFMKTLDKSIKWESL